MKINKKEALALAKVLHANSPPISFSAVTEHDKVLQDLVGRLERFILIDGAGADLVDAEHRPKASPAKKEAQPCNFFGNDDDDDCTDEVGSCEQEAIVDIDVSAGDLHDLAPVKTTAGVVEFEYVLGGRAKDGHVDLLLDGDLTIEHVTHLRRHSKALEVKPGAGDWVSFEVTRFPKGWTSLLPVDDLVGVVEGVR